jgi:oxygen-dependent protoporphyrinogen oxidase
VSTANDIRNRPHVVVVGGGISGLAAAYRLQQACRAGHAVLDITLIEADDRLGGKILTEHHDGLTIEAGPDSFLSSKPAALELCRALGLEEEIIGTTDSGGGTYILRAGRLEPLPEGITMLVPTRFRPLLGSRLLSPWGKLRLGLDLFIPARRDGADESVGHFVRRRLGREAYERMAQPLLSGIYAGDADRMSLLATFPRLRETELKHGSLTRGMLAQRRSTTVRPASPRQSAFLSLRDGLGALVDALTRTLAGVDIRLGTRVTSLERSSDGRYAVKLATGEAQAADAVILALPAYAAGAVLAGVDDGLSAVLNQIPYVSTATAILAFRASEVSRAAAGRGFVIPSVEGRELTAVTWVTNKFSGRAPEGVALVRGFVGRAGREEAVDLSDEALIELIRGELREILGLQAAPFASQVYRWRRALPQYELGHLERLREIDDHLTGLPGILLAGAAYRGVGIPDCIESGSRAAEQALSRLGVAASSSASAPAVS